MRFGGERDRPRVVRLITRLNVGGPARQALLLSRELNAEFPTTLIAGRAPPEEGALADEAVPVRPAPLVRPVRPALDLRALWSVRRTLAAVRPAIVHTHMAKAGAVGRAAARSLGGGRPRTVHTFHGHVLEGYFSPRVQSAFIAAERRLARWTDVLVAVSSEVRDELLDLGIGRTGSFRVIPLGLELDPFLAIDGPSGVLRSRAGIPAGAPVVGAIGRLVPIKAIDVLIDAMAEVPDAHLVLVGDGEERGALAARAVDVGVAERVHFTGWFVDVAAALADCDVVALSSRNEGTPVALIEALAAGRPVVATHVGGVAAVVVPGETGLLVPPGDAGALATAIRTLLVDRALAERLATAGRARAAAEFGADRLVRDVRLLYRELVN
jgi:glycosyltransferase involved in cell wall biosynthesis